jgi:hypothetical protein
VVEEGSEGGEVETARKNGEGGGCPKTMLPIMLTITRLRNDRVVGQRGGQRKTTRVEIDETTLGMVRMEAVTLGARVPGFWWEHAEYIAGIETLCPAFAQQEHPVHIWNVIWVCAPNVPIGNILFTACMRPCCVSKMYPPGTFQMLSTHVHKMFPAYAQWACCGYMHFVWMFSAFSSIFWCTFMVLFKTN